MKLVHDMLKPNTPIFPGVLSPEVWRTLAKLGNSTRTITRLVVELHHESL